MNVFEFIFTSPIEIIDESETKIVEATLLAEGVSKNGRLYTIEEMKRIAKQVVGKPVFYGVDPVTNEHVNPLRGHENVPQIGEVVKAWFDETTRKIKAHIKLFADFFETVKDKIKKIGVSIGGKAKQLIRKVIGGKTVWQVVGAIIDHIQLVPPNRPVGVKEAKVENVIQESFTFATPVVEQAEKILVEYNVQYDPRFTWIFEVKEE